jgi:hypothetical protein
LIATIPANGVHFSLLAHLRASSWTASSGRFSFAETEQSIRARWFASVALAL